MVPSVELSATTPELSVVVPVYNVKPYLAACLDSLLAQTFTDLEVVLVDDGSTDGSSEIAAGFVRGQDRWRLIRTANHGLGAARNRGVAQTRGTYIAFLDSDDLVPAYAYELMVSTLHDSGSDFVVGSLEQLIDGQLVEPAWIRRAHQRRRLGVKVDDLPQITHNVFAWNKVFRRSFYERAGLSFPEGVRYEDQVAITEAYLRADAIDVVRRPVYIWRLREDGSSITQRRHELADLEDRIITKQLTTDLVRRLGSPAMVDYWARNGLPGDLPVYFREIPRADALYWRRLVSGVRELFAELPPIHESRLRVGQRLVGWLVTQDRRADAETVLRWLDEHPGPLPLRVEGDHVVAGLPFSSEPTCGVPPQVCWLGDHELEYDARLVDVRWDGATLVVEGWALVRGAPTAHAETDIRVRLQPESEGPAVAVEATVTRFAAPQATAWVDRAGQDYDDSGFVARLDVSGLVGPAQEVHGTAAQSTFSVEIEVVVADIRRSGRFRSRAPTLDLQRIAGDADPVDVWFPPGEGLFVRLWARPSDT